MIKKEVQLAGAKAAGKASRQRSLDEYYKNPNICLNCSSIIDVREGEKVSSARKKKFCSRSCAGSYNNGIFPKRKPEGACVWCGTQVRARILYCSEECRTKSKISRNKEKRHKNKAEYVVSWRQRTKLNALEYKGSCCQRCGYNRCANAMDFHHIDPSQKEFQIAAKICSWDKLQAELDKCLLLCSNCHREFHAGLWKIEEVLGK